MATIYGIPNCDTVRKARTWLADHGVAARFHDVRRDGLDAALLERWADRLGWEALLNRSGTTFRQLPLEAKASLDRERALALMLAHPTLIKRPVLEHGDALLVGFKPALYAAIGP